MIYKIAVSPVYVTVQCHSRRNQQHKVCNKSIRWLSSVSIQKQHQDSHCKKNRDSDNKRDTVNKEHSRPLPSHREAPQCVCVS